MTSEETCVCFGGFHTGGCRIVRIVDFWFCRTGKWLCCYTSPALITESADIIRWLSAEMWTFFFQKLEAKVRTKSFFLKWTVLSNLVRRQDRTDSISKIWLGRLASLRQEALIVSHKNFIGFHKHVQREGEEQGCLYCHLPSDPSDCETHQIIIVRKLINTTINTGVFTSKGLCQLQEKENKTSPLVESLSSICSHLSPLVVVVLCLEVPCAPRTCCHCGVISMRIKRCHIRHLHTTWQTRKPTLESLLVCSVVVSRVNA